MTRAFRNAALLCFAGILVASAAVANVPDPTKCKLAYFDPAAPAGPDKDAANFVTVGTAGHPNGYIQVEGSSGGVLVPDNCSDNRCADFRVIVNDVGGLPIAGSTVIADFSGCFDIRVSCDQRTSATTQVFFAGKKVQGVTNASGIFIFKIQGAANATPTLNNTTAPAGSTPVATACATIYADGVALTPALRVAAYDVNSLGSPGGAVGSSDTSLVAAEGVKIPLGATAYARDDYNRNGTITSADTSAEASMGVQAGLGTGTQNTQGSPITGYCP